jgi:hypothetical protein
MAEIQVCQMKLKRLKETDHLLVEIQNRPSVPKVGDIIEMEKNAVRGRVVQVASPPAGQLGIFYIDLEELAPGAT